MREEYPSVVQLIDPGKDGRMDTALVTPPPPSPDTSPFITKLTFIIMLKVSTGEKPNFNVGALIERHTHMH